MAYAVMLRSREQLIAMYAELDLDNIDKMLEGFQETAERLKAIVLMLDTAYTRVVFSGAAAHKRGVKFKWPKKPGRERKSRRS
jgi:hypothetical protein